ncbi:tRNA (adenosine(37)-N6)-dimethylallyltransferase MiaA [Mariniblastus fucicola]|uniref:tRNA dimethylallyltransferase n=1 Tax=Mariniblastus fucicola TaxID=980251 RepID=A0A5B9PF23_9BACT|nr:tRNA (adenosine(37)-N6)-dimethylallyltransferase MiaA [Mariniblastus fucicola]QEG21581.1 IPP transferase [Mariniblastus fucicola]
MTDRSDIAKTCWFLTGATASGKSSTSLELAKRINAEIISLDSMAIYRGMDIGTAKPPVEERGDIPHHLIDIRDPSETFSTSQYRDAALQTIDAVRSRGKEVLFVGGTALYLKALLRGMFEGPPADWEFRKKVEDEIKESGGEFLHERLQMVDPVAAHNIHPNDHRRLIRALEVFSTTGKPISHWQMEFDSPTPAEQCRVFAIRHERSILHQRIEQRVGAMFDAGLIEEVRGLLEKHGELSHTAAQAVGYREVIEHLNGQHTEEETKELVLIRTRRFARHQETWFRNLSECRWVDLEADFEPSAVAEEIIEMAGVDG